MGEMGGGVGRWRSGQMDGRMVVRMHGWSNKRGSVDCWSRWVGG